LNTIRGIGVTIAVAIAIAVSGHGAASQTFKGVNLAGAAYSSSRLPGVYGRDFVYPNDSELRYFASKGMNVFRISILWERLQPALGGDFDPRELARLSKFIDEAEQQHASVIIDVHNYGRYRGVLLGQSPVSVAAFADLWTRLGKRFGSDESVLFGLMNEPQLKDQNLWRQAVQGAIDGIRTTGARNRILVPGIDWDAAHSFASISGDSLGALHDPQHRLVFEVHEYFDSDSSGTSDRCVSSDQALGRLSSFTQWLHAGHHEGFLGEFGVSRRPECVMLLDHVASYLASNSDVWLGWTYWAAGPLWGNYMFSLEPSAGRDRPQMTALAKYLRPELQTR
jgi:endoglucanase